MSLLPWVFFGGIFVSIWALYAFTSSQSKRKYKNVYNFAISGWRLLKDDQKLFDLECVFSNGLVHKVLKRSRYSVTDFHSNLAKEEAEAYSGLIQMTRAVTVSTTDMDFDGDLDLRADWSSYDRLSERYFYAKLKKAVPAFLQADSKLLGPNLPAHFQQLQEDLGDLETMFGFQKWVVIAHGNELVVLVAEIFDLNALRKFLKISSHLAQKLES